MLRDDIKDKVLFLLHVEFDWVRGENYDLVCDECSTFDELGMSISDVRDFAEVLVKEFEIEGLQFNQVMSWIGVRDVIDTIEGYLENALE